MAPRTEYPAPPPGAEGALHRRAEVPRVAEASQGGLEVAVPRLALLGRRWLTQELPHLGAGPVADPPLECLASPLGLLLQPLHLLPGLAETLRGPSCGLGGSVRTLLFLADLLAVLGAGAPRAAPCVVPLPLQLRDPLAQLRHLGLRRVSPVRPVAVGLRRVRRRLGLWVRRLLLASAEPAHQGLFLMHSSQRRKPGSRTHWMHPGTLHSRRTGYQ